MRMPKITMETPKGGVTIRHKTVRNGIVLIPCMWIPMRADSLNRTCPTCNITHRVKTIHLQMSPTGTAIVSHGVLRLMRVAGLEEHGLSIEGSIGKPPPLRLTPGMSRAEVDYRNRSMNVWSTSAIGRAFDRYRPKMLKRSTDV